MFFSNFSIKPACLCDPCEILPTWRLWIYMFKPVQMIPDLSLPAPEPVCFPLQQKSSFHAIKQPQQQKASVGEREGNHSIKPDGESKRGKKQARPKQPGGNANQSAAKTTRKV